MAVCGWCLLCKTKCSNARTAYCPGCAKDEPLDNQPLRVVDPADPRSPENGVEGTYENIIEPDSGYRIPLWICAGCKKLVYDGVIYHALELIDAAKSISWAGP